MPADIPCMPIYGRHFEPGQLQFITTSTYRRSRLFTCQRFSWIFVETLRQLRQEIGFLLIGWVLMPEHFHLLIRPQPAEDTVHFMRELKKRSAQQIIAALQRNRHQPRCRALLARCEGAWPCAPTTPWVPQRPFTGAVREPPLHDAFGCGSVARRCTILKSAAVHIHLDLGANFHGAHEAVHVDILQQAVALAHVGGIGHGIGHHQFQRVGPRAGEFR